MQRKKRAGLRWPRLDFGQPEGGVKESVRGLKGVSVPVEPNEAFLARLRDFHAWIEVCVCACVSPLLPPPPALPPYPHPCPPPRGAA